MRAYDLDLTGARAKIESNAKAMKISEATLRQRLITLPGPVRDAYTAMLEERGVSAKGEALLGEFV
jgi:outer membrane protein TolC